MARMRLVSLLAVASTLALVACQSAPGQQPAGSRPSSAASAAPPASPSAGPQRFGAPVDGSAAVVALPDLVARPQAHAGKVFVTSGTVTAVCQHMGCWMEMKDEASEAHVRMAGHAFFVPRSASGRRARVMATLVDRAGQPPGHHGENHDGGCGAGSAEQPGRTAAKVELEARGVELL
jgi:hypothetical protein